MMLSSHTVHDGLMVGTTGAGRGGDVLAVATVADRPDLIEPAWQCTRDLMPEYNNHGEVVNEYWPRLTEERPE